MSDITTGSPTAEAAGRAAQDTAQEAAAQGKQVANAAAEQGRRVASTAADQARGVAQGASDQVASVGTKAMGQARSVLDGATEEVRDQLEQRLRDLATSARTTADELQALVEGRPDDAGRARDLAERASQQIGRWADKADELGVQGVVEEVSDLARRRPVLFLAGAATAGVVVGRMARAGKEIHDSGGGTGQETVGASSAGATPPGGGDAPGGPSVRAPGGPSLPPPEPPPLPPPVAPRPDPGGPASGWVGA